MEALIEEKETGKVDSNSEQPKQISSALCSDTEKLPQKLAEMALDFYNEAARIRREQEFKFVRTKCWFTMTDCCHGLQWCHLNFAGHPMSGLGTEDYLFFAEIKYCGVDDLRVMIVQIVGLASQVSARLSGCVWCDKSCYRDEMVHPVGVTFTKHD